jgi:pyruvate ferredoxin oxidoreductase alpha subunit
MAARDFGWIQIFSENSQEAYDNLLQAIKIAEHPSVKLPVMVTTDGFIISHCLEKIEMLDDSAAKDYIGKFKAYTNLLDTKNPVTVGALDLQNYYFEHRRQVAEAMKASKDIILEVGEDFGKRFKRKYGLFETYKLDDADIAVVCLGSTAGSAKAVIDEIREKGIKAGLLKIRVFRPFASEEISSVLENIRAVAVIDRSDGLATTGGPVFNEIRSALYDKKKKPIVVDYICGLGGREITHDHIKEIFQDLQDIAETGSVKELIRYKGLRSAAADSAQGVR